MESSSSTLRLDSYECGLCENPDDISMLQCACGKAFHRSCLGVDHGDPFPGWKCSECARCESQLLSQALPREGGSEPDDVQMAQIHHDRTSSERQRVPFSTYIGESDRTNEPVAGPSGYTSWGPIQPSHPAPISAQGYARENDVAVQMNSMRQLLEQQRVQLERYSQEFERLNDSRFPGAQSTTRRHSAFDDYFDLSRSQVAARHVASGKLPKFSGNPDEWHNFKSRFETSTRMCRFTDDENIMRLQECLTGKARQMVQYRLQHPEHLGEVMQTLEKLFGRPEVLIQNVLRRIRQAPPPRIEKLESVAQYGIDVDELCATVRTSGLHEYTYNATLLQELVERLPPTIRLDWGLHRQSLNEVTLVQFGTWMKRITDAAISVTPPLVQPTSGKKENERKHVNVHAETESARDNCVVCERSGCPTGTKCTKFIALSVQDRWSKVRKHQICKTCLKCHQGRCVQDRTCGTEGCTARHHPLLHQARITKPAETAVSLSHSGLTKSVILRYIPVTLHGEESSVETFALLDEGSSVTLMDQELTKELGLKGKPKPICLSWTGGLERNEASSRTVALKISGANGEAHELSSVRTVEKLALPRQMLDMDALSARFPHLQNCKATGYEAIAPRILIGADNYYLTRALQVIEGGPREPIATKCRLGWSVCGVRDECEPHVHGSSLQTLGVHICRCEAIDANLEEALSKYFAIENPDLTKPPALLSKDDERALKVMKATTRQIDGRYETGLLWRAENINLPNNRNMALNRLVNLEKRMQSDATLANVINEKIEGYLKKGYVRKLTRTELDTTRRYSRRWYLPIFPVTNINKPGKLRLVWDAAAEVRGTSLNTQLLTGPDLLTALPSVLYKFREYRYAVVADIREMYHQIAVRSNDQHSQRFLWRWGDTTKEVEEYVMTRMTFGARCSPSCAQYVKNINADKFAEEFPHAVRCIKEQHYVDDMLVSVEEENDAIRLAEEIKFIHGQGGFELHNWISNSEKVMEKFGNHSTASKEINSEPSSTMDKVLGMWWDRHTDTFSFRLNTIHNSELIHGNGVPTKRQILRILMSIYDPLGLISGFLFYLKVILQEVWRTGIDWDEEISTDHYGKWKRWVSGLEHIQSIKFPRFYRQLVSNTERTLQLHIFVDAGKDGYAAVAYFRFQTDDNVEISLIGGKARVAPIKYVSIPRLELQAAVIGARLATTIREAHDQTIGQCFLWTDSRDVMSWINSDHRKYSVYVAHRVGEILERTRATEWRWVPTKANVADECTKWTNLDQHLKSSQWLSGPPFLKDPMTTWLIETEIPKPTEEEAKKWVGVHSEKEPAIDFERFSKWRRLHRALGYVHRFIYNSRNPASRRTGPLTAGEYHQAEMSILREAQQQAYPEETASLRESKAKSYVLTVGRHSPLFKRSPYVDEEVIIRVTGRIDACEHADRALKRPIILPRDGKVTDLVVADYHRRFGHANQETVVNEVPGKFDIPALRRVCARVRRDCFSCRLRERARDIQ